MVSILPSHNGSKAVYSKTEICIAAGNIIIADYGAEQGSNCIDIHTGRQFQFGSPVLDLQHVVLHMNRIDLNKLRTGSLSHVAP